MSHDHSEHRKDAARVRDGYAELAQTEPPDLLDQAILNRARQAVEQQPSRRPWGFGWVHALSTLGLLVLSLGIFQQLREPAMPAATDAPDPMIPSAADAAPAQEALPPPTPMRAYRSAPEAQEAVPEAAPEPLRKRSQPLTPDAWLAQIRRLRETGQDALAASELAAFRATYPDYILPEDLQP